MGRDKATLPFGPELMLQRVVRLLGSVVRLEDMVAVAAPNQPLPTLPEGVRIARDALEFRGPLQGLATGLAALGNAFDAVYATACDVPLLVPELVDRMFEMLGNFDIAVPFDGQHHHPLAAVYRPCVLPQIHNLLDANRMRPFFLFGEVSTREVPVDDLRRIDSTLSSLENLNHYEDYLSALAAAGYSASPDNSR